MSNLRLIERIDDGEVLIENDDNTFSFLNSKMSEPFKYEYEILMEHPKYKGKFRELIYNPKERGEK